MRPLPSATAASRRTTRDLLLVGVAALLVGAGLLLAFRAGHEATADAGPREPDRRRLLEALLLRAEAERAAAEGEAPGSAKTQGDTGEGSEDGEAQPGDDVMVDDSPEAETPVRWRRARRIVHVRSLEAMDDFEDEVIVGQVSSDDSEQADEGEWGWFEGGEGSDGADDRREGDEGDSDDGLLSACSASLPCLLQSSFGEARPFELPASTSAGWSRAREALRAGRYQDAAAGFARAATLPSPPSGTGSPRPPAAAERRLLCRMAAVALLADPTRDAGLVDTRGVVQAVAAETLGECAPELGLLLGRPSPRAEPPDTTHL